MSDLQSGRRASQQAQTVWGTDRVLVKYGKTVALKGVSLRAPAGQVTAVVGGDGAGKSTLLRCLAGSLAPDEGTVTRPPKERGGYFPASSGIYEDLTVAENLDFRAVGYGLSAQAGRERTALLLDRAGLASAAGRLAGQLSGGMRQKLGVIAAMLHQPDLLVLDEPTTGVDPVSRSGLWWLITRAAADGCAVVLATTYLDEAERCAQVLVLDQGSELASGTPDEIIAAMPGRLRTSASRPDDVRRAWRRAGQWRVWEPDGAGEVGVVTSVVEDEAGEPGVSGETNRAGETSVAGKSGGARPDALRPDLQDAVTVAALARELAWSGNGAAS